MNTGFLAEKKYKCIFIILILGAVLVNIKSIFTDYNYDSGYAVALAYRMLQGDGMFAQMWEPHQTSGFLCAGLMKLYLMVTNTTTGVVLYLQVCGVLIKGLVTILFYQSLKRLVRKDMLAVMCLFFFAVTPKGLPMPEFSNMQIWFSVGVFSCLMRFLHAQEKKGWLFGGAVFLCLEILAYPSCLIVYAGVVTLLFCYGREKGKDILTFSGICLAGGVAYCSYFVARLGVGSFMESIGYIVTGDGSHDSTLASKVYAYIQEVGSILLQLAGIALMACVILIVLGLVIYVASGRQKRLSLKKYWPVSFFVVFLVMDLVQAFSVEMSYDERMPIYVPIIIGAVIALKKCTPDEKRFVVAGLVISLLGFAATLMLTNLTIGSTLNYLILAVMVACVPIIRCVEALAEKKAWLGYGVILLFCGVTIFRSGYIMKCMSTEKTNVLNIAGIVREGPAKGLVSEYMGPHILNSTYKEWQEYVEPGDRVLIVSGLYDPVQYLFEDVEISVASTICTSTYDEKLLEYWEKFPEKRPNVVIVDCWFGELRVDEESWIMQWLAEEFEPAGYVDGSYWRYYE